MSLRPAKIEDVFGIEPLPSFENEHELFCNVAKALPEDYWGTNVLAYEKDGRVAMVIGILEECPGVGFVWAAFDRSSTKYRAGCYLTIRRLMPWAAHNWQLHRMVSYVREGNTPALEMHLGLGFEIEGTLRHYPTVGTSTLVLGRLFL